MTTSLVLLGLIWTVILPATPASTRSRAGAEDPGRTLVYVLVVITSSASRLTRSRTSHRASTSTGG